MSINNLVLSPVTLTGLYKKSLVEILSGPEKTERIETINKVVPIAPPPEPLAYLGNNLRQVALLVNYNDQVYLPDEQLLFLTSILKACQLTIADIAIINMAKQPVVLPDLKAVLGTRQVILFGPHKTISDGLEIFTIHEMEGMLLLAAPELEKLNTNTENGKLLKSKLWLCLKQLFNV